MFFGQKIRCLFFYTVFIVLFSRLEATSSRTSIPASIRIRFDDPILSEAEKVAVSYRRCLLGHLGHQQEIWKHLGSAILSCLDMSFAIGLDLHIIPGTSYVAIVPTSATSPCVSVRVGNLNSIGLKPEKGLRRLVPQCQFHGAGEEDLVMFSSIGTFHKKIISYAEPGDKLFDSDDSPDTVKLKTFLEQHIRAPRIDYLWIHSGVFNLIRGTPYADPKSCYYEYAVLKDPIDVTLCQVNIETLTTIDNDGVDALSRARPVLNDLMISILTNSSFLPIMDGYFPGKHSSSRQFYVNFFDPYCIKKFLARAVCRGDHCHSRIQ